MDDPNMHAYGEDGPNDAEIGRQWRENSSLEKWFPITAERLAALEAENAALRAALAEPVLQALTEADRIMGHDDEATEWRERWAHLFKSPPQPTQPVQEPAQSEHEFVGEVCWAANIPNTILEVFWKKVPPPVGTKLYAAPKRKQTSKDER